VIRLSEDGSSQDPVPSRTRATTYHHRAGPPEPTAATRHAVDTETGCRDRARPSGSESTRA